MDVEIQVNVSYTLQEAHKIVEEVHENIEQNFPKGEHIMMHVDPAI
ncbi:MAG: cation transporter dimerization domain-containing protein [Roseburia sp.]